MSQTVQIHQRKADQQSFAITAAIMAGLFIILLFIKLQHPIVEDAISGVMIDFGDNKEGLGTDNEKEAGGQNSTPVKTVQSHTTPTPPAPPTPKPVASAVPVKAPPTKTVVSEDPQAVAIAKQQKEEKERQRQQQLEQQRIAEAVKKAEAERVARAAEETRIKDQMAGVFTKGKTGTGNGSGNSNGNGPGNGEGNTKPGGNQGAQWGTPGGDKNGTGTGPNGNGPGSGNSGASANLTGRTWTPHIPTNTTSKTGKVVLTVKVDRSGNVLSAVFQQKGSTTTDLDLIRIAISGAMKSRFSQNPNADEEQIGTITYNFIVR